MSKSEERMRLVVKAIDERLRTLESEIPGMTKDDVMSALSNLLAIAIVESEEVAEENLSLACEHLSDTVRQLALVKGRLDAH